jgi:hypothetical protein
MWLTRCGVPRTMRLGSFDFQRVPTLWRWLSRYRTPALGADAPCNVLMTAIDNVVMEPKTVAELVDEARQRSADARDELVRRHYREIAAIAASAQRSMRGLFDTACRFGCITSMASATPRLPPHSMCPSGPCDRWWHAHAGS